MNDLEYFVLQIISKLVWQKEISQRKWIFGYGPEADIRDLAPHKHSREYSGILKKHSIRGPFCISLAISLFLHKLLGCDNDPREANVVGGKSKRIIAGIWECVYMCQHSQGFIGSWIKPVASWFWFTIIHWGANFVWTLLKPFWTMRAFRYALWTSLYDNTGHLGNRCFT